MPLPRVANILRQTLAALGEAHHLGITHPRHQTVPDIVLQKRQRGDLADHVSVIDFGVARIDTERGMTERGRLLGTPHYMAPEAITANAAGPSVDLYAVGVILFEMLTGRVPFDDASPMTICLHHASAPRPDPRLFSPDIPDALADVCFRALADRSPGPLPGRAGAGRSHLRGRVGADDPQAGVGLPAAPHQRERSRAPTSSSPSRFPSSGSSVVRRARPRGSAPTKTEATPLVGRDRRVLQWAGNALWRQARRR